MRICAADPATNPHEMTSVGRSLRFQTITKRHKCRQVFKIIFIEEIDGLRITDPKTRKVLPQPQSRGIKRTAVNQQNSLAHHFQALFPCNHAVAQNHHTLPFQAEIRTVMPTAVVISKHNMQFSKPRGSQAQHICPTWQFKNAEKEIQGCSRRQPTGKPPHKIVGIERYR